MKNKTASILNTVAYTIWILGGIGVIMVSSDIGNFFRDFGYEELAGSISLGVFIGMGFNVFSTGLVFFGLARIIELIEERLPKDIALNKINNSSDEQSTDLFKF